MKASTTMNTLPWIDAAKEQPRRNVRVLVHNDSGMVGLGQFTGSDWHTDFSGSHVTHWCPLGLVPRPEPHPQDKSAIANPKS